MTTLSNFYIQRNEIFEADTHDIFLLSLGSDVLLSLFPKSGFGITARVPMKNAGTTPPRRVASSPGVQTQNHDVPSPDISGLLNEPIADTTQATKETATQKKSESALEITLVHGDVLVLSGDVFRVSYMVTIVFPSLVYLISLFAVLD